MISFVEGILCDTEEGMVVIDTGGIGYAVTVPASVISCLPSLGEKIKLYTSFQIREDSRSLYGFMSKEERNLFNILISLNGIGPKAAVSLLSVLTPNELYTAVLTDDEKTVSRAQGIGTKTAKRLIMELKDKLKLLSSCLPDSSSLSVAAEPLQVHDGPVFETITALQVLGYSAQEATVAVKAANTGEDMTTEQLLKAALRNLR